MVSSPRSVEARRFHDRVGDLHHRLADEERAERAHRERHDEPGHRVDEADLAEQEERRDEGHLRRHEEAREDQPERERPAAEAQLGERIARREREADLQGGDEGGHQDGVEEIPTDGDRSEHLAVGAEVDAARNGPGRGADDLVERAYGGERHPRVGGEP